MLSCFFLATVSLTVGCGREYAGASEQTYKIATALVAICDRKVEPKLAEVETLIEEGVKNDSVSEREANYLQDIVEQARAGEWEAAEEKARQVLSDQVE